ncbi:DUF6427 family protein [Mesonia sp. HuA40]|uniref:DUF6427 family protein n=1 Tax=Mesonia sp. HuA40 TaxID=2602761 RepID=UPI0011CA7AE2|nr:DUF6427 family protein [Mesonia sp. HuA40]TXK72545.1 hypothetical protein FT993_06845 [Mesonia sp. HuA40]
MLTSFFKNSKPINFLVLLVLLLVQYLAVQKIEVEGSQTWLNYLLPVVGFLGLVVAFLYLNAVVKTKAFAQKNTYAVLIFVLGIICFYPIFNDHQALLAYGFWMIALRILFGMQDVQHFGKKLFDLSFFLVIAATFNPQLYIYLLFAYLSILFFSPNQITHYFIPILACLAVWLIVMAISLLGYDDTRLLLWPEWTINFDWNNDLNFIFPLGLMGFLLLLGFFGLLAAIQKSQSSQKIYYRLVLLLLMFGGFMAVFQEQFLIQNFIYLFLPLVLMASIWVTQTKTKWKSESVLLFLTILGLAYNFLI